MFFPFRAVSKSVPAVLWAAIWLSSPCRAYVTGPTNVGGGYTAAGMTGFYFANPDLKGVPAFTRKDVRISFDWGTNQPVGGSLAEPYKSFPVNGFSVR